MPTFKGRWAARVEQDFEIDAENEAQARELLDEEMSPRNVVELLDFDVKEFEMVKQPCEWCGDGDDPELGDVGDDGLHEACRQAAVRGALASRPR